MNRISLYRCLLLICCMPAFSLAQSRLQMRWGPTQKEKLTAVSSILGKQNGMYYAASTSVKVSPLVLFGFTKSTESIRKYNRELNASSKMPVRKTTETNTKLQMVRQYASADGVYVFQAAYEKAEKQYVLYLDVLDPLTLMPIGKRRRAIDTLEASNRRFLAEAFTLSFSPDSSKIMVFHEAIRKKKDNAVFMIHVFEGTMTNLLWRREVEMPYLNKDFQIKDFAVDNMGNVFVTGKRYQSSAEKKKSKKSNKAGPDYDQVVLLYRQLGKEMKEHVVKTEGKYLMDMIVVPGVDNEFMCSGYYADKALYANSSYTRATGAFRLSLNVESGAISKLRLIPFSNATQAKFMSGKAAKRRKDNALDNLVLRNVIVRKDGSIVLIGEQYFRVVRTQTSNATGVSIGVSIGGVGLGNGARTTTMHYYNHIVAMCIDTKGNEAWTTVVPKYQAFQTRGSGTSSAISTYYSFAAGIDKNDKLYIIYNDNVKNIGETDPRRIRAMRPAKSVITCATIDAAGVLSRSVIGSRKTDKMYFNVGASKQVNAKEFVLVQQGMKTHRLGILNL